MNRTTTNITLSLPILLLAFTACTNGSSSRGANGSPVPTSQMHLHVRLESTDTITTDVNARLDDGRVLGTQYRLDGDDYLRTCLDTYCRNLRDSVSAIDVLFPFYPDGYATGMPVRSDVEYVVSFNRSRGGAAPNTRVRMPAAFNIQAPQQDQEFTDGDMVDVLWAPAGVGNDVYAETEADCTHVNGFHSKGPGPTVSDSDSDGHIAVRIDSIISVARASFVTSSALYDCDIDVTVFQERRGTIDPAFAGGEIKAIAKRRVNIHYFPM